MSTAYHPLRSPVVLVRPSVPFAAAVDYYYDALDRNGILVAIVHGDCLRLLADMDSRVAHRSGNVISVSGTGPDNAQAISDYGELVTLGDLRRGRAP